MGKKQKGAYSVSTLLTRKEAAARLGIGQPWIYSLQRFLNSLAMFSIIWAVL